jgi:hypothetical protein
LADADPIAVSLASLDSRLTAIEQHLRELLTMLTPPRRG